MSMDTGNKSFRLNQAIAKAGLCSRRNADKLIALGRVTVNGKINKDFSQTVNPLSDKVCVDGKLLKIANFAYVLMYKPRGIVTTLSDEKGRRSIVDLLPAKLRHLRPVGRLDMMSEGLILLTNDGDFTQRVAHPKHHLSKQYMVTVQGKLTSNELKLLSTGMLLSDGRTLPAKVTLIRQDESSTTFCLVMKEGRNRQIRRMCAQLGYRVSSLVRVGIGELQLGEMTPGSWRYLTHSEIRQLESGAICHSSKLVRN
ncbi:MAG: rRNA pseudouridine synthase [Candidatus Melainabacteria bacterium]|nr:rRNA pseudouridine synthase [Candidatus Melainabacteria bacterium]